MLFQGSMVALVTPMHENDNSIDYDRYQLLIDFHLKSQTDGLIIAGTTGEAPTLTREEHSNLVKLAREVIGHQTLPLIVGVGTHCTQTTLELAERTANLGVDGLLLVTPYYNKPAQTGLIEHYKTISQAIDIPQILYNVPGRTACDLLPETAAILSQYENIIGIKETVSVERVQQLRKVCPATFGIYCGDDANNYPMLRAGANGLISVTANIAAADLKQMCQYVAEQRYTEAEAIHQRLMPLHKNLFIESNPIPVKWAMQQLSMIPGGIRLPLTPLAPHYQCVVKQALEDSQC